MTDLADPDGEGRPPARVRVTSPLTSAGRHRPLTVAGEIDDLTQVGEVYVRSLVRSQLRLAASVLAVLASTLGALPLLFVLVPATREVSLLGLPLPWLVLGGLVYPLLVLLGWVYLGRAERVEEAFTDLVDRP